MTPSGEYEEVMTRVMDVTGRTARRTCWNGARMVLVILGGVLPILSLPVVINGSQAPSAQPGSSEPPPAQDLVAIRAAAEQGDAVAQNHLGNAYAYGKGVPDDLDAAIHWFQRAAG